MWGGEIPVSNDGVTIARELAEDLAAHVITCVCVCMRAQTRACDCCMLVSRKCEDKLKREHERLTHFRNVAAKDYFWRLLGEANFSVENNIKYLYICI